MIVSGGAVTVDLHCRRKQASLLARTWNGTRHRSETYLAILSLNLHETSRFLFPATPCESSRTLWLSIASASRTHGGDDRAQPSAPVGWIRPLPAAAKQRSKSRGLLHSAKTVCDMVGRAAPLAPKCLHCDVSHRRPADFRPFDADVG
jgi:hypothetical protein